MTKKYYTIGLWIFVFLTISILTSLYAVHADIIVLLYVCTIIDFILLLCLLFVLMQTKKTVDIQSDEIIRLRERERSRIKNNQQTSNNLQNAEVFGKPIRATGLPIRNRNIP